MKPANKTSFSTRASRLAHWLNRNSREGSRRNISAHYDLGNDLYETFLDSRMMYSSAIYADETSDLEEAAGHKLDIICRKLDLKPGDVIETYARRWSLEVTFHEAKGKLGFISPLSHHFCDRCNRLRLTSEGNLRACLLHDAETDLRALLRQGCSDEDIRAALVAAVRSKPQGHHMEKRLREQEGGCHGRMSRIGG